MPYTRNDQRNKEEQAKDTIPYPNVDDVAVDEYDTTIDLFTMAFPWLFPGGVGGPFDIHPKKHP